MEPANSDITVSDVVVSRAGRDQGEWFYVIDADDTYLLLVNGKDQYRRFRAVSTVLIVISC